MVHRRLAGHIVADGIALALKVVMRARIPAWLLSGIGDIFELAEPPNDIALPIDLDQIRLILVTVIRVAEPSAAKDLALRQQLVWKSLQTLPQLDFFSIHIDEQGAEICRRKNGVPAPRLGGIIQSDAGRINRWVAHLSLLLLKRRNTGSGPNFFA